jgi:hypothetical protein
LWLASIGTTVPTVNVSATALRFFFKVTLKRRDLADAVVSVREPRRLPVVLSPEEVGRLQALKRQMVAETQVPGASVSIVARRHDVNSNQLFRWRRQLLPKAAVESGAMVPVAIAPDGLMAFSVIGGSCLG